MLLIWYYDFIYHFECTNDITQMKPAFSYARLKKGDAYRKHTQRECDKVVRNINWMCIFINFQEARITIRSDDSGDSDNSDNSDDKDDKDDKQMTNKNNNKRKRQAPSKKETARSNAPIHESPAKRTNRTLNEIEAENSEQIIKDKAVDKAESGGNSVATRTTPRDDHGSIASPKTPSQPQFDVMDSEAEGLLTTRQAAAPIGVVTDTSHDSWEDFVVRFQDKMQRYRNLVRDLREGDCTEDDVQNFEGEVRSLGSRLVSVWKDSSAKDLVKSRAKQLLSYVATYCETHDRPQMNSEFVVLLAQCVEGINCFLYWIVFTCSL